MRLIAVGRQRKGPEAELFARYNARLRPALAVTEIVEARGSPAEVKRREAMELLSTLPDSAFVVVLDSAGETPDSIWLGTLLERWLGLSRTICFLIGGTEGLDASVIAHADYVLSFGPLTWPHFLMRPMLAEQLFRAQSIVSGHPYHRPGRP